MKPDKHSQEGHQGEGDRISVGRYVRHLRELVTGQTVEPSARAAGRYVERLPDDAACAERRARSGPHHPRVSIGELVAKGHTVLDRVQAVIHRVFGRFIRRMHRR